MREINTLKAHLAINVKDVKRSVDFYTKMFGIEPSKVRTGYAKFDVANPPLNFTLNQVAFGDTFFVATTRLLTRKDSGVKDFPDLAGKTVVTNQGTTSERILRKMNEEKKMNMQIISAKDYGEGRMTLETGRAVAYMMDDVLLAGTRTLTAKPADWVIVGTPQSSEAYGFMLRKGDPAFLKIVDDTLAQVMKSGEIDAMYDRWFMKPVPPKNMNFDFPMSENLRALYKNPNDKAFE